MLITPYLLGRGGAAGAMKKSLGIIGAMDSELALAPVVPLERGTKLETLKWDRNVTVPVLLIANPHALHCRTMLEAELAGFRDIVVEKPACVSLEDIPALSRMKAAVSVCHGYRQMWGPQTIAKMIRAGELGEIISVEGKYWQSSAAQTALRPSSLPSWKNDTSLSGPCDVYLDLGSHWADLMFFFAGEAAKKITPWRAFANAEAPHRDTHVWLQLDFDSIGRTMGSLSKTVHGAGNELEVAVVGTRGSLQWKFQDPDRVVVGRGGQSTVIARTKPEPSGAGLPPFHAAGWIEGYCDIIRNALRGAAGLPAESVPTLPESLRVLQALLSVISEG